MIEAKTMGDASDLSKRTAVVKPLASTKTKPKKAPPVEEEKVAEVKFKSPTRNFNSKKGIKRKFTVRVSIDKVLIINDKFLSKSEHRLEGEKTGC